MDQVSNPPGDLTQRGLTAHHPPSLLLCLGMRELPPLRLRSVNWRVCQEHGHVPERDCANSERPSCASRAQIPATQRVWSPFTQESPWKVFENDI